MYEFYSIIKRIIEIKSVEEDIFNASQSSFNTLHRRKRTEMAEKNISGLFRTRGKIKIGQLHRLKEKNALKI